MRTCKKCGVELTIENCRVKSGRQEGYLNSYCHPCEKLYQKEYRATHKDQIKEYWKPCDRFSQRKSRRGWYNFSDYMRLNPIYFYQQFGREYTEHNVLKEYTRLDKFMKEMGI
jgi:hypothetical protein